MNNFGGNWTIEKMNIVTKYAKAYLEIMKMQTWAKTIYFDGFAGSGYIENDSLSNEDALGTALRILEIQKPKGFDMYYFVELDEKNKNSLQNTVQEKFFGLNAHVVKDDCNNKLKALANFLKKNKNHTALVFIDPYGMSVKWESIRALKDLRIDLWILVPTGLGVNRMLKNDGNISKSWMNKLEEFLGISDEEIKSAFYNKKIDHTLFGEEEIIEKDKDAIQKIEKVYKRKLNEVFKFVSEPFVMKNSTNSIMYHFFMATNNATALKIANEVIKPDYKI